MTDPLLSVRDLRVRFEGESGEVRAVDGVSFDLDAGETLCLVGESGSGKTVTCEALTRLVPADLDGEIRFDGRNLLDCSETELREIRGSSVAHVFQNPQGALDPVYSIGDQLREGVERNREVSGGEAREVAIDLLDRVGIPEPTARYDDYPHEFSGGMKQRVVIALALSGDPDLLVADEPTTALDVTIQAQILDLLRDLQAERDVGVLFVTHDLGVAAQVADRIVVMYAGKVMERGGVSAVFDSPGHPYTRALMRCLPGVGSALDPIPGDPIDPTDPPEGCRFHPRCTAAVRECESGDQPPLRDADPSDDASDPGDADHCVSCVFYGPDYDRADLASSVPLAGVQTEGDDD
ncbi:ABC transporter ATP-binding protein [Halorussus sp. MSC15.2]|uniref:ABC transporter ATP-binding protein n=1 Tax=Halorussus sp. MSC15.2 TaxID=2283638 RepID=UPI0013D8E022|nr:ABC transporter ATP-binding protein [Halorussus sp. MSC15.2]NEU58235.1 ABC transporter ATP-binding protein [Halorussus sp. MSC15.2]